MNNEIKGYVTDIIYKNEKNGYAVIKIKIKESDLEEEVEENLTLTGLFPEIALDQMYKFVGNLKTHDKYGLQFICSSYEAVILDNFEAITRYLSSELFFGVGPKLATKIVETLGLDCIKKIIADKTVLNNIIKNESKVNEIYTVLETNLNFQNVLIELYKYGFNGLTSSKIYSLYKGKSLEIIKENPYVLIDDFKEIGFDKVEKIAIKFGIERENENRVKALIIHIIKTMMLNGDTYVVKEQLIGLTIADVNKNQQLTTEEIILNYLDQLVAEKKVFIEYAAVMLDEMYQAEQNIVKNLNILNSKKESENYDKEIEIIEKEIKISYSPKQKEAITEVLNNQVTIITGGPGTGKTTVINGIIKLYQKVYCTENNKIALVAPTGRASKKMSESCNLKSKTIHSFLGYDYEGKFEFNEQQKIYPKLIIIDESSMIDTYLFSYLINALGENVRVVIVGDNDQLPSVGPGQVLKDLIDSEKITVVRLDVIFRQSSDSGLIKLAHAINSNEISLDYFDYSDITFVECDEFNILENVNYLIEKAIERKVNLESLQVLAPMYKGKNGIDNINSMLQSTINPNAVTAIEYFNKVYKINDKVLQLVNRPKDGVMNGDVGKIIDITGRDKKAKITIDFDGNIVTYEYYELKNFKHAYCMSIHKSQGSEYEILILPISKSYSKMFKRKLIYTAVTRAKKNLILVGTFSALKEGVELIERNRRTLLKEKF